jgi:hypothetical protein
MFHTTLSTLLSTLQTVGPVIVITLSVLSQSEGGEESEDPPPEKREAKAVVGWTSESTNRQARPRRGRDTQRYARD